MDQLEVVVSVGLLGGKGSSATGKTSASSFLALARASGSRTVCRVGKVVWIGGVLFLYAKARLCGARGGWINVKGSMMR